jgi:hypothetical protein
MDVFKGYFTAVGVSIGLALSLSRILAIFADTLKISLTGL